MNTTTTYPQPTCGNFWKKKTKNKKLQVFPKVPWEASSFPAE